MQVVTRCFPPSSSYSTPSFDVPAGACDSHCHVTPRDHARVTPDASYVPQPCPPEELARMRNALGLERSVIVQASVYGLDNRGVEAALAQGPQTLRGVVVSDRRVSDAQLSTWHQLGVRGMRFIMSGQLGGTVGVEDLVQLAPRLAELGWHAEILPRTEDWNELLPVLTRLPCRLVIDHLGGMPAGHTDPAGVAAIDYLIAEGRTWVKLIGYRLSEDLHDPRLRKRAQHFYRLAPHRMVWGSDWPHVGMAKPQDAGVLLDVLAAWLERDPAALADVLVRNPEALFDFGG